MDCFEKKIKELLYETVNNSENAKKYFIIDTFSSNNVFLYFKEKTKVNNYYLKLIRQNTYTNEKGTSLLTCYLEAFNYSDRLLFQKKFYTSDIEKVLFRIVNPE